MKIIKKLCNFGTLYLWIFAWRVLHVYAEYRTDAAAAAAAAASLIMKPYPYQIFDDYTDELLNERNVATTPIWPTIDKHQQQRQQQLYYKSLPLTKPTTTESRNGNSMTSNEITFENLNDFGSYKIKNAIWPGGQQQLQLQQQLLLNRNRGDDVDDDDGDAINKQLRHSLQHIADAVVDDTVASGAGSTPDKQRLVTNIRYKNGLLPIVLGKRFTKERTTRNPKTFNSNINENHVGVGDDGSGSRDDVLKENLFPLKDDDTVIANIVHEGDNDENDFASGNGNGNENVNYSDNNEVNTNYMIAQKDNLNYKDHDRDDKHTINGDGNLKYDKRAKPSYGHTPFLPAVSGGAMTNLGKFFRDLSKNVHFSEQYQWGAEDQKLLEGDPNFGNIHHHLTKPKTATDQQTAEWVKAIRFYRPSQKIRSLVAMNPHGQWAHSSQFIDPNYMWVGLGK